LEGWTDRAAQGEKITPPEWGGQLLRECEPIAAVLDDAHHGTAYRDALSAAGGALRNPSATPSARILREMEQTHDKSYLHFALAQSVRHRGHLLELPLSAEVAARHARMAEESLAAQRQIEAGDAVPFEIYRQQYLSQDLLSGVRLQSET